MITIRPVYSNTTFLGHSLAVIPPEIKRRGPAAEEAYRRALRKGKEKIPRCNLQILGEERVGKTSLFRSLTGKNFIEDLDSTRGIDNRLVDTLVDIRPISMAAWKEVNPQDEAKKDDALLVTSVIGILDKEGVLANQQAQSEKKLHTKEPEAIDISEEELLKRIEEAIEVFEQPPEDPEPPPPHPLPPPHSSVTPPHHQATPVAQQQPEPQPPPKSTPQTTPSSSSKREKEPKPAKSQTPKVPTERDPNPTQPSRTQPSHTQSQPSRTQPSRTAPKEVPRVSGTLISRRLHQSVGRMIKTSPTRKEPTLHLNTYDFAGQKQYRPMHHCFITRRALYLVVFNLQHMIKYLNDKDVAKINPLEEIRYWLNSIHAHIHKPTEKETKQVYLVGTHKAPKKTKHGKPLSESDLKEIHVALDSVFGEDSRAVNHLCYTYDHEQIFSAIENSLDGEGEREASGITALQNYLTKTCGDLSFLQEQYPIIWLRFERGLLQLREECRGSKTSPLIKLEEVQKMAQTYGIEESENSHALRFFHDTGTIVWLSKSVLAMDYATL